MSFRVGDVVTIYRKIEPPGWGDQWTWTMSEMIGQSFPVTRIGELGCKVGYYWFPNESLMLAQSNRAAKQDGVRVIYDIESGTGIKVQREARLGFWDWCNLYKIRGWSFGRQCSEEEITADGLVQYVHLEQVESANDGTVIPTSEQLIDELLANGWSLADG
jgi:hypothetical protein